MTPSFQQIVCDIVRNPLENPSVRIAALNILQALSCSAPRVEDEDPATVVARSLAPLGLADNGPRNIGGLYNGGDDDDIMSALGVSMPVLGGPPVHLRIPVKSEESED